MDKVRVYLDEEHLDFYLTGGRGTHRRDILYGAYDSENALNDAVARLLKEGHDLLPRAGQRELGSRYVSPRLLEWPDTGDGEENRQMLYADCSPEEIRQLLWSAAHERLLKTYGAEPAARTRLDEEWQAAERAGNLTDVAVLHEIAAKMKRDGRPFWLTGSAGASFLLFLLGVTRGDPLRGDAAEDGGGGFPWQILWPDGRPSWFEVRLPSSAQREFNGWLRGLWLFRLEPELPLEHPAPDRIHFSHIQLNFTLDDAKPPQSPSAAAGHDARASRHYLRTRIHVKEYLLFEAECGCL